MKLSKRQLVLVAGLVLALAAMIAGRLVRRSPTGPSKATAASPVASEKTVQGKPIANPPEPPQRTAAKPKDSLATRLDKLAVSQQLNLTSAPDAFRPPQAWMTEYVKQTVREPQPDAADKFAQNHQLRAVMVSESGSRAVVDDRCLLVGRQLDGFTLVSVTQSTAAFESDDQRVVLKLQTASER